MAEDLEKTLTSILEQDYKNKQIIVIDGGSAPETIKVLQKYAIYLDELVIEPDEGIFDAMNKGLQLVKGQWVHFMNAGDLYAYEDSLSILMEEAKKTHSLVYCDVFLVSEDEKQEKKHPAIYKHGLFTNVCHQCVLYNYKKLKPFTYDLEFPVAADFDSLVQAYYKDPKHFAIHVKEPLIEYKLGGSSDHRMKELLEERKGQFIKYIPNPIIRWWNLLNLKRQVFKYKRLNS